MIARTLACIAALALSGPALAYPGGTPSYQTDVAPFCASCHSSRDAAALAGAGERATKELAENKHLAVVRKADARSGYAALSEADRATLIKHIQALDAATSVVLEVPASVKAGATFSATVRVKGGAGPVVGVALVDRDHRWYARPAASVGWQVVDAPRISVGGTPKPEWLDKRPAADGRNLSFVNVPGISSDAATGTYADAEVTFTLRAPSAPGSAPLAAVLFYGTEKGSPLGTKADALGRKHVLGGFGGGSGRVLFTPVQSIAIE
jgi:hypothetical protein